MPAGDRAEPPAYSSVPQRDWSACPCPRLAVAEAQPPVRHPARPPPPERRPAHPRAPGRQPGDPPAPAREQRQAPERPPALNARRHRNVRGPIAPGTGAGTGAAAGNGTPAGTAPAAIGGPGRTTGAGGATPAICCMQFGPPIGSGAAAVLGLNARAAPHNPALAAIVMPDRSTIFNANSPVFGFGGAASTHKGCGGTVSPYPSLS